MKMNITRGIVPFVGRLTIMVQARISNWFEKEVAQGNQTLRHRWIGLLPIAHTHTLYLVHKLAKFDTLTQEHIEEAWILQKHEVADLYCHIDVDKECLLSLEEEMFEKSNLSGIAGHYQWGLDAGDHQDVWNPYIGLPEEWNHGNREGSDEECQVSFHDR